jgi:hypothetical protein
MRGTTASRPGSPMLQTRVPEEVVKKAEKRAEELGFVKPSGAINLSEYIRFLILKDLGV